MPNIWKMVEWFEIDIVAVRGGNPKMPCSCCCHFFFFQTHNGWVKVYFRTFSFRSSQERGKERERERPFYVSYLCGPLLFLDFTSFRLYLQIHCWHFSESFAIQVSIPIFYYSFSYLIFWWFNYFKNSTLSFSEVFFVLFLPSVLSSVY